jgi:hypothetical protein
MDQYCFTPFEKDVCCWVGDTHARCSRKQRWLGYLILLLWQKDSETSTQPAQTAKKKKNPAQECAGYAEEGRTLASTGSAGEKSRNVGLVIPMPAATESSAGLGTSSFCSGKRIRKRQPNLILLLG